MMNSTTGLHPLFNSSARKQNLLSSLKPDDKVELVSQDSLKLFYFIKIDDDIKVIPYVALYGAKGLTERIKDIYSNNEVKVIEIRCYDKFLNNFSISNSFITTIIDDTDAFLNDIVEFNKSFNLFKKYMIKDTIQSQKIEPQKIEVDVPVASNELTDYDNVSECNKITQVDYYELLNEETAELYKSECYIYYNQHFNNILQSSILLNSAPNTILFPEFTLIYKGLISDEQITKLNEIQKNIFVNFEDASSSVNKIVCDKIIDSKLSINDIKKLVQKYFTIDTNIEKRMKFTTIWESICKGLIINEVYAKYIKNQLPIILTDLGLNKKRYSDGIYWYGLTIKQPVIPQETKITEIDITQYIKIRDSDNDTFKTFFTEKVEPKK